MTSTQIIGGSIKYTVPSNFQSGKEGCEVTIHFTVAEGANEAIEAAIGDRARREALRLATGGQAALPTRRSPPPSELVIGGPPTPVVAPVQGENAAATPPPAIVPGAGTKIPVGTPIVDVVGLTPTAAPVVIGASASSTVANGHAEEITDEKMREAVQHKLARLDPGANADQIARQRGPVLVGALLAEYAPPPAKVYSLSQPQRAEFLAKLEGLE